MDNNIEQKNISQTPVGNPTNSTAPAKPFADRRFPGGAGGMGGRRDFGFKKNPRRAPKREVRAKPEFDHKVIDIRRVTRVVAGGKRMSFSVAVVIGNRKGSVGVGIGKAADTSLAIEKSLRNARKNLINVGLTKTMSISRDVEAKYASSRVMIMPAPGRGLVAGSSVRDVIELAGIKDITAKIFSRSKNKLNNAMVAIKALSMLPMKKKQFTTEASKKDAPAGSLAESEQK